MAVGKAPLLLRESETDQRRVDDVKERVGLRSVGWLERQQACWEACKGSGEVLRVKAKVWTPFSLRPLKILHLTPGSTCI